MAAVIVAPHPRPIRIPATGGRPPLRILPGGRGARVVGARPIGRLHPSVYRRRRVAALLVVVALVVAAYLAIAALSGVADASATAPRTAASPAAVATGAASPGSVYVVQPGDTIWSIARTMQPQGDVRRLVDRLSARAGGTSLQPGQAVRVDGLVD